MNPQVAFDRFVKSPNRIEESKLIGAMAKRDPEFKGGLSSAMREHIQGMTDPQLIKFMDNAGNQKLITDLFGDRMLSQWKKIANDARRDQLRTTQNKVAGSNTQKQSGGMAHRFQYHRPCARTWRHASSCRQCRQAPDGQVNQPEATRFPRPAKVAAGLMKQSAATPDAVTQARTNLGKTLLDFPDIEKRALIIHNLQMQERKKEVIMPRNGAGTATPPAGNPVVAGTTIKPRRGATTRSTTFTTRSATASRRTARQSSQPTCRWLDSG